MTPPPLQIEHRCRVSALEREKVWSLRGDVLWIGEEGRPEVPVPLASLRKVRLEFAPTRFQTGRYHCHLYGVGSRLATIQNEHYAGVANFEDRSGSYLALVEALLRRTARIRPDCRLEGGTWWLSWAVQTAFLLLCLLLLVGALLLFWTAIGWLVVLKLAFIAWFLPTGYRWIMKNRPQEFRMDDGPPRELLPDRRPA